jgi:RHS repeat-associated protein
MEPGLRTLSIKADENEQVTVVKSFNVPVDFTFDISDNNFEIRYNDDMYTESAAYDVLPGHGGHSASSGNFYSSSATTLSNSTMGIFRTSEMFNTYYIYTFDGKLLAEYDHNGNCTRDYIYFGKRMLAEYKPQTGEYFYYMSEQINSTRIITNDNGDVVFSEAYGSYGDVQKTWVNTYDPDLKFSGKEREGYSGLDYFGARYYDHKSYRFNSVDPVITKDEALSNPQLWNLYAYCSNNPITHLDPDGRKDIKFDIQVGMWQSDPSYWDAKKAVLKDQFRERALFTYSLSLGVIFPPWVFASSPKGNAKTPGKFSKIFKGKPFPEKLNRGGIKQPFNPINGKFLPYSANPGIANTPFTNIAAGFSQGIASGLSGAQMPAAGTRLQSWAQSIGQFIGTIASIF